MHSFLGKKELLKKLAMLSQNRVIKVHFITRKKSMSVWGE